MVENHLCSARPRSEEDIPDGESIPRVCRAPHRVARPGVEPVLRLHACGEGRPVGVRDAHRIPGRPCGREDEGDVTGRRVLGGDLRKRVARTSAALVRVDDVRRVGQLRDRDRGAPRRDDESSARGLQAHGKCVCCEHLGAGNGHDADLEAGEHDLDPLGRVSDEDDDAVSRGRASLPQECGPPRRVLHDLMERPRLDHSVGAEEHQRPPLGIACEHLDHVSCEVEAVRHVPGTLRERRAERDLDR